VSLANVAVLTPSIKVRINISNMLSFISPPEENYKLIVSSNNPSIWYDSASKQKD
jgi:hypothetical protein